MITNVFPTIFADSVTETADFYRHLAGFEEVFATDWYVQLQAAGDPKAQIGIVARTHQSVPTGHQRPPAGMAICIEVDDVDEIHARAVAAGLGVILPLQDEEWGQRHFITLDPAGSLVDVITPIAPSTPDFEAAYCVDSSA